MSLWLDSEEAFVSADNRVVATVPYVTAAIFTGAIPLFWCAAFLIGRFVRPETMHRCRKCGYDVRASPDRCPECGTPVSQE